MAIFSEQTKNEIGEDLQRAKARLKNLKDKAEEQMGVVLSGAATAGTAFGFGYLRGRMTDLADEDSFKVVGLSPEPEGGTGGSCTAEHFSHRSWFGSSVRVAHP